MIDADHFFDTTRKAFGPLKQTQVDGFNRILEYWPTSGYADLRWLVNMLAQVWHETGTEMVPVREKGSEAYLRSKPYYPWVGEGLIQVTWQHMSQDVFGAKEPGDLMSWPKALDVLYRGMGHGLFTGRELGDYFNMRTDDPYHARRIVNGMDRAALILGYHRHFLPAVKLAA